MQPYFFPYIGYFQLISSVDEFVIYDNIKYTKKGWINRNRLLLNGRDTTFTLPLKNDSDRLAVVERKISDTWSNERLKLLDRIKQSYKKSEFFDDIFAILQDSFMSDETNLFEFVYQSLVKVNAYLEIKTPFVISSGIPIDHSLKSEDKVIAIVKERKANLYVNAIGGIDLYSREKFKENSLSLKFIKSNPIQYAQWKGEFVPWLSIIDVMMHNSKEKIREYLKSYTLI